MQSAIDLASKVWTLILAIVPALTLAWIVLLLAQKFLTRLHLFPPLGVGYSIQEVEDPPIDEGQGNSKGVGRIVRMRILDELSYARKGPRTLQRVDGPEAPLPSLIPALPDPIGAWTPIVNTLLRPDRLIVWVTALRPESGRAAIHIRLCRSPGKVLEVKRFEEPVTGDDVLAAYNGAAMWAGAWLSYMLAKYARSNYSGRGYPRVELLGTDSWESYAMLRRGLQGQGSNKNQRAWYDAALREDHHNIGALIALGQLEAESVRDLEAMREGIGHLKLAHDLLSTDDGVRRGLRFVWNPCKGTRADPQWYQCLYSLTVAHLHRYYVQMRGPAHPEAEYDLDRALRFGVDLAQAVGATQLTLWSLWKRWAIAGGQRQAIKTVLDREDVMLANTFASPMALWESLWERTSQPQGVRSPPVDHRERADSEGAPLGKRKYWQLLAGLNSNKRDKFPSAETVLDWEDRIFENTSDTLAHVNYRRLYNRACTETQLKLYFQAMRDLKLAFKHLSTAAPILEGRRLPPTFMVDWAEKDDPALEPLLKNPRYGEQLRELFKKTRQRVAPDQNEPLPNDPAAVDGPSRRAAPDRTGDLAPAAAPVGAEEQSRGDRED